MATDTYKMPILLVSLILTLLLDTLREVEFIYAVCGVGHMQCVIGCLMRFLI